MNITEHITKLISPTINGMGYEVVRVLLIGKGNPTLQIMAERIDERPISVDDCALISQTVSALLDVENPISGAYNLEISSPGIDRPLTRLKDFERFLGSEARIETRDFLDGRKRFKGVLKGLENETIILEMPEGMIRVPFQMISRAKLVLTDDLIAAEMRRQSANK